MKKVYGFMQTNIGWAVAIIIVSSAHLARFYYDIPAQHISKDLPTCKA